MNVHRHSILLSAVALTLCLSAPVWGQPILVEDFNGVTGTGGGEFFNGSGEGVIEGWDDGLLGENAFAGATVRAFSTASASGDPSGGVGGTGAGVISVLDVSFNPLNENFEDVSGNPGGGVFMDSSSGSEGFTDNWDNNISGEAAFAGVGDGAVLNGTVSAQAIPGSDLARLDVDDVTVNAGTWYAGLMFAAPPLEGAVTLLNGGFEQIDNGAADQITAWGQYGNWGGPFAETATGDPVHPFTPYEGLRSMKMFGNSGAWQDLPAEDGQTWEMNGYRLRPSNDTEVGTTNNAQAIIEFYDAGDVLIGTSGVLIFDDSTTVDVWEPITVSGTAPASTASARIFFRHDTPDFNGGAILIDAVTFEVVAGPPQSAVDLSAISLTATVRGTVDAPGETLGDYFLRIEDTDGDRLVFEGTADGTWQSIGGPLDTAIEMDNNGVTTNGVFNPASPGFTVVVTFDNDSGVTWGVGGTLDLDEVILTGEDPLDSEWYAGLFWNNLVVPSTDMSELSFTADIKGDVVGGDYVLRLEGLVINSNGVDESFTDVAGTGNQLMVSYDMNTSGAYTGWSDNWDDGIGGEAAFAGLDTGGRFCSPAECPGLADAGMTAKGIASGGNPDGYAQLKVTGLWQLAPGGGDWWAGLMWQDVALASSDLTQVELRADVQGFADPLWAEQLGMIELRIEDEDGDRRYKQVMATTSWQTIGGTLDTFTEGPPASGVGGNGQFDTDQANYTIVVAFADPFATWAWGGTILADNVFLTPADVQVELGRVSFPMVADGDFQSVGGLLTDGDSTFQSDLTEDMESATGASLTFYPPDFGGVDVDPGLANDEYFAGTWGSGQVTATVATCTTCGFGGSKGYQMISENPAGTRWSGGWWSGLALQNNFLDIDNLEDIVLTAKVKGETAGTYGVLILKLEDANLDAMQYIVPADGTWQTLGGAISTTNGWEEVGSGNTSLGSDGVFDPNSPAFKVVVVTEGPHGDAGPDWNATYTVTMDDVFLTRPGRGFGDAELFTAVVTFENEMTTWGTAGTLTVDNLNFSVDAGNACIDADVNCDGQVTGLDISEVKAPSNWQKLVGDPGVNSRADVNGDGQITGLDISDVKSPSVWQTSTGPCTCPE